MKVESQIDIYRKERLGLRGNQSCTGSLWLMLIHNWKSHQYHPVILTAPNFARVKCTRRHEYFNPFLKLLIFSLQTPKAHTMPPCQPPWTLRSCSYGRYSFFSRIFLAYKSKVIHMLIPGKRLTSSPYIWPLTIQSWKVRHLCNIMPPGLMAEIPAVTSQASISFPKEGGATWNKKAKCSIRRFKDFNGPYMSLCIVFEYCTSIYFQTDHNFFGA